MFDPAAVDPPLTEEEILDAFRSGSTVLYRTIEQIAVLRMDVVPTEGADSLPDRLRASHREIRPRVGQSRSAFKNALKELE